MSNEQNYEMEEFDYSNDSRTSARVAPNSAKRRRPQQGRARGKGPQSVNGIHRRRRRKMAW
ncbi:MAG: hypothetical protein KDA37_12320 [Planctomycetales bacterium]|nr:hypothetical protein [Planctomycetales bacterium]